MTKKDLALRFLKACGVPTEELSEEAWEVFTKMNTRHIIGPLIIIDRRKGLTIGQLQIRYKKSEQQIRWVIKDEPR